MERMQLLTLLARDKEGHVKWARVILRFEHSRYVGQTVHAEMQK